MIRTWKSLLGTVAVCALLAGESKAQEIRLNQVGVARLRTDPLNETQSADSFYGAEESVWLNDFQPPPGIGVDPVTIPNDNSVGYAVTSNVDDILYRISRTNRHFYGLDDGFTSAHAFIPLRVMNGGTSLLAINPRAFVDDDGRGGVNLGVTARRYFASSDRLLTSSLWVDYDEGHRGGYAQVGLAGSIIGRYLTTSAFANVPIGEKGETWTQSITAGFEGNQLVLNHKEWVETPYAHYQVEVATPIPYFSRFGFEYGLGAYALASRSDGVEDGFGVSNRIEAQVTEDLTMNTLVTSDGVFGSNLSINLELTIPNGMPSRVFRRTSVKSHLTRSDLRSYRVFTDTACRVRHVAAIDPKDGLAYTVAHIDPNSFGNGSGVNDPFGSIQQFESLPDGLQSTFDIVYVRGRNDGSDTNLNTTLTLFDCQQLLGTGTPHLINTTLGVVPLVDLPYSTPLLTNSGAPGMDVVRLADMNVVSGVTIDAGGTADGINGLDAGDFGVRGFNINRSTIRNAVVGVNIDAEDTADNSDQIGIFRDNLVSGTSNDGLRITYDDTGAPSGDLLLDISNNIFEGILAQGIDIDLSGNAVALFDINDNTFAYVQQNQFITGLNFTSTTLNDAGFVPPSVNGSVGPEHIVELVNGSYAVFDKDTGALITRTTLDQFWIDSGAVPAVSPLNPINNPRLIFDRSTGRWFAAAIDSGPGNSIFVAVSNSSDPTAGWTGFEFVGDSQGVRQNSVESLGVDANGLYISTTNLGGAPIGQDISFYSIPKADLIGVNPTIANMSRFENLSPALYGQTMHASQDFGAFDGEAQLLGLAITGTDLVRVDLTNTDTPNATLSLPTNVPVPPIVGGPGGGQPLAPPINDLTPFLASNVVEVGDSIWAVHTVAGTDVTPNSAVRWYEIDAVTDTVIQTGLIEDPEIDFVASSIAVNERGQVTIGFTGSSSTLNGVGLHPSSMAVMGSTNGGVTTFGTPVLLQQGLGDYAILANQWGAYSATVRDPMRDNVFWTFQEWTPAQNLWAIQVTELIAGAGGHDGILVTAQDNATVLAGSDINNNRFVNGTGTAITVQAFDNAFINLSGTISDNFISGMGTDGMFFATDDNAALLVDGDRNIVINNGQHGLSLLSDGNSTLDVDFRNSVFDNNAGRGIKGTALGGSMMSFSLTSPFDPLATEDWNRNGILDPMEDLNGNGLIDPIVSSASNNGGPGIDFAAFDAATLDLDIDQVLVDPNADAGITVLLGDFATGFVDITNSTIIDTVDGPDVDLFGEGVVFRTLDNSELTALVDNNLISGHEHNGFRALADGDSTQLLNITNNIVTLNNVPEDPMNLNTGVGMLFDRRTNGTLTATVDFNTVTGNGAGGLSLITQGGNTGTADTMLFASNNIFSNNGTRDMAGNSIVGDGVSITTGGSSITFANFTCNVMDSNAINGISVTTNNTSFFGEPPTTQSVFDSNVVTNNGDFMLNNGNGILLTENDASFMYLDIISDAFAAALCDTPTTVSNNAVDGIHIETTGSGTTSIRIGNAANPFPDVIVDQNLDDAIQIAMSGTGTVDVSIDNALLTGARRIGSPADPGVNLTYTGDDDATVRIGQDMGADHVIDDMTDARAGVDIYDFADDGIFVDYNRTGGMGFLSLLVANSRIGLDATRFNGGDGVEINARNDGFVAEFYNNIIRNNGGDGIRMISLTDIANGRAIVVPPIGQDVDTNNNMIGDQPSAGSPTLLGTPGYVLPWGDDFAISAFSTIIVGDPGLGPRFGGNDISANLDDGLELSVGAGTLLTARVRGNTMTANTSADFRTSTATNPNLLVPLSTNNAEGMNDIVVLDPIAHMFLEFGDSSVGTENINMGNILLPTVGGGTIDSAGNDVFKGMTRAILNDFVVVVPNEMLPPADNLFTIFGVDQNEAGIFTANGWTLMPMGGQ